MRLGRPDLPVTDIDDVNKIQHNDWVSQQRKPGTLTQSMTTQSTEKPYGVNDLNMSPSHRHKGGLKLTLQIWVTDVIVSKP